MSPSQPEILQGRLSIFESPAPDLCLAPFQLGPWVRKEGGSGLQMQAAARF